MKKGQKYKDISVCVMFFLCGLSVMAAPEPPQPRNPAPPLGAPIDSDLWVLVLFALLLSIKMYAKIIKKAPNI